MLKGVRLSTQSVLVLWSIRTTVRWWYVAICQTLMVEKEAFVLRLFGETLQRSCAVERVNLTLRQRQNVVFEAKVVVAANGINDAVFNKLKTASFIPLLLLPTE